ASKGINQSVCCAISKSGILHYKIIEGGYNILKFIGFLNELHENASLDGKIIIMDNVPFHKSLDVREWFMQRNINVKYLPPYCPQLNPIEEVFSLIKSKYHAIKPRAISKLTMIINIASAFDSIKLADLTRYYEHMRIFLMKILSGQEIN
ncbi:Transposable element Tc1 transposase, partial [Dictyocoela muelleri]